MHNIAKVDKKLLTALLRSYLFSTLLATTVIEGIGNPAPGVTECNRSPVYIS